MCLIVGDSLLVVDAAVQGDVDAEGQESHGVLLSSPECASGRSLLWHFGRSEGSGVPIREQPCCTYRSRCFSNTANVEGIDAEISCSHYVGFEVIKEVDILGC